MINDMHVNNIIQARIYVNSAGQKSSIELGAKQGNLNWKMILFDRKTTYRGRHIYKLSRLHETSGQFSNIPKIFGKSVKFGKYFTDKNGCQYKNECTW